MLYVCILGFDVVMADGEQDVKYKLGWIVLPGYGAVPVPDELWTGHFKRINLPLTFWLTRTSLLTFFPSS